jgi:phosphopantothenoylcysteine decarboxylase / phosphopantothenate---cysteine ligase
MLKGKKILLGITGSIAAYKAAVLCRLLIKEGAEVRVIMTPNAHDFISPLTLSTLSGHEVHSSVSDGHAWNNHVGLGLWADAMLVAPCTATTLAKMAHGIADNILVACYLSAKCPVYVAPAMDLDMWKHGSTKDNLDRLEQYGNKIIPVGHGFLASGLTGDGRMAEPEDIVRFLSTSMGQTQALSGTRVVITAGPTYEAIDPVRFIGNRSSGKQGIAIAEVCRDRGAYVTLVIGPTTQSLDLGHNIEVIQVQSAQEMYDATAKAADQAQVIVLAAAVADYKSKVVATEKLKKKDDRMSIELERTIDIAATLGKTKRPDQCMIGFALETNDEVNHAIGKLQRKNLDFIVLNSLNDKGAGFAVDTNKITILDNKERRTTFDLKSKNDVAHDIVQYYIDHYQGNK